MEAFSLRFRHRHAEGMGQQRAWCREKERVAGAMGWPRVGRWPGELAPRREAAADCSAPVTIINNERACRAHCPAIACADAVGTTTNTFDSGSAAGTVIIAAICADGRGPSSARGRATGSVRPRGPTPADPVISLLAGAPGVTKLVHHVGAQPIAAQVQLKAGEITPRWAGRGRHRPRRRRWGAT